MEYTPEMTQDFQERAVAFQGEYDALYAALQEKYQIEILHAPIWVPGSAGLFVCSMGTNLGDLKYKPLASDEPVIKT